MEVEEEQIGEGGRKRKKAGEGRDGEKEGEAGRGCSGDDGQLWPPPHPTPTFLMRFIHGLLYCFGGRGSAGAWERESLILSRASLPSSPRVAAWAGESRGKDG